MHNLTQLIQSLLPTEKPLLWSGISTTIQQQNIGRSTHGGGHSLLVAALNNPRSSRPRRPLPLNLAGSALRPPPPLANHVVSLSTWGRYRRGISYNLLMMVAFGGRNESSNSRTVVSWIAAFTRTAASSPAASTLLVPLIAPPLLHSSHQHQCVARPVTTD